jgi:N-acetyltransferase
MPSGPGDVSSRASSLEIVLEGRFVRLEPLRRHHTSALARASAEDRSTYGFTFVPADEASMAAAVEDTLRLAATGSILAFVILRRNESRVVGWTRFSDLTPWVWPSGSRHQRQETPDAVEIGATFLAASAQRSPVNTETKLLMLNHAFANWNVHRVRFRTDARNTRSRQAIERLGARFEGILRADRSGADDTVRDSAYYSILSTEWPALRHRLEARLEAQ